MWEQDCGTVKIYW